MTSTVRINKEIKRMLKIKSAELGIKQIELLNRYVLEGLKRDNQIKPSMSVEDIEKLLENDKPEGDTASNKLIGLVDNPVKTNSVQLKKDMYRR